MLMIMSVDDGGGKVAVGGHGEELVAAMGFYLP